MVNEGMYEYCGVDINNLSLQIFPSFLHINQYYAFGLIFKMGRELYAELIRILAEICFKNYKHKGEKWN